MVFSRFAGSHKRNRSKDRYTSLIKDEVFDEGFLKESSFLVKDIFDSFENSSAAVGSGTGSAMSRKGESLAKETRKLL